MSVLGSNDLIAVTSKAFSQNKRLREALGIHFKNVRFNETGRSLSREELLDFLSNCQGAIVGLDRIDRTVINLLPKLKVISKYGVGLDNIELEALEAQSVFLGWKGGLNKRSVAELALSMMLLGIRRSYEANRMLETGNWQPLVGRQLTGKTVGIIGCGHVGKELVELLKPFECKVLVHDIQKYEDFYTENRITACALEEILSNSDLVTLHVPLTQKTKYLINESNIGLLKKNAVLINTARGGIVREAALLPRLETMDLYCGFDVFEEEPTQTSLIHYPTFFATPHIGGSATEAQLAMGEGAIRGLLEPLSVIEMRVRRLLPVLD